MARFRGTTDDLRDIIRREKLFILKRQGTFALTPLAAGCVLLAIFPPAGFIALGMCLAWSLSVVFELRAVAGRLTWKYAWLLEDIEIKVDEEGIRLSSSRGMSLSRWGEGVVVRSLGQCFVLEDLGEDFVILPKRYLDSGELMVLQDRAQS
jgi:hypothetical protein